jgi:hypothetical protein
VLGDDVSLNFIRTGPHEIAKWALSPWLVYFFQMSVEFLDSIKGCIALYTNRLKPGKRGCTFAAPAPGVLSSSMLSSSAGLSLGYVSMFSNHGTRRCLPRWGES